MFRLNSPEKEAAMSKTPSPLRCKATGDPGRATLRVLVGRRASHPISPYVTGKFCEHLWSNIYRGMWSQILQNSTFADYPFGGAGPHPDGGRKFECDEAKIEEQIRGRAEREGWPPPAVDRLLESRADGLAHWWIREGEREAVRVSPDAGPHGGRAQRIELSSAGQGIAQWTHLPLHRVRKYRWRIVARSSNMSSLRLSLTPLGEDQPAAAAEVSGLSRAWKALTGEIELDPAAPADAFYRLSLTGNAAGQFVVARILLEPADSVGGADPDVVHLLKESRLPILRWPGGNFVSGYHWEDGVGPADARPTRPNFAWGCPEPNLFGTDEFVAFCRAVGCEPMICVNAGAGTPEDAARWVEYCNGPPDSPQGARRAANGYPEPYSVRYWEIGNELYGRWQVGWTTPDGYADRYGQFVEAMRAVDSGIRFMACGNASLRGRDATDWNGRLFAQNAPLMRSVSDHVLLGGSIEASADPLEVYADFMALPDEYEARYADLRDEMEAAGIEEPRLAITELQLFGRVKPADEGRPVRLTHENLVSAATMAEAVYLTLFYHVAVRLGPFIEMITHSATLNHGGGLRKHRERVYVNPCYHARSMFSEFGDATPVEVALAGPTRPVPGVIPTVRTVGIAGKDLSMIAAVAAIAPDGALLISLVNRAAEGRVAVDVEICDFEPGGEAKLLLLSADEPWAANTLQEPQRVAPAEQTAAVRDGRLTVDLPSCGIAQLRLAPG